jgi:hypothetical protein
MQCDPLVRPIITGLFGTIAFLVAYKVIKQACIRLIQHHERHRMDCPNTRQRHDAILLSAMMAQTATQKLT